MIKPLGSSAAELIRKPVESRVIDWLNMLLVFETFESASIALRFVLIENDIQSSVILPIRSCNLKPHHLTNPSWVLIRLSTHYWVPSLRHTRLTTEPRMRPFFPVW